MSTLAIWCRVFQSRDVSPHNFDGLTMSGLAFSVAPVAPETGNARLPTVERRTSGTSRRCEVEGPAVGRQCWRRTVAHPMNSGKNECNNKLVTVSDY